MGATFHGRLERVRAIAAGLLLGCAAAPTPVAHAPVTDAVSSAAETPEPARLPPELASLLVSATRVERTGALATPPHQGELWEPPAAMDARVAAWTRYLYDELSLPDPRGTQLHWVVLTIGTDCGIAAAEIVTTAFVLPHAADERATVIAWSGDLYPAAAVGSEVGLDDALARTQPSLAAASLAASSSPDARFIERAGSLEAIAVTTASFGPTRLGMASLAPEPAEGDEESDRVGLTVVLAQTRLVRAIGAFARGDDDAARRAIADVIGLRARLTDVQRAALAESIAGGDLVDTLRDELARREAAPPVDLAELAAATTATSPTDTQVGLLLSSIDQVQAVQLGWPGGPSIWQSRVAQALRAAGERALPGLFDAIEHRDGYVRGVGFFRPFVPARELISVADAASWIAITILEDRAPWAAPSACAACGRAASLRSHWEHVRDVAPVDGWLAVLRGASSELRVLAPTALIERRGRPFDETGFAGTLLEAATPATRDEVKRALLERMATTSSFVEACADATALAAWSDAEVVAGWTALSHRCETDAGPCACETELTVRRALHDDTTALPEWEARIRRLHPVIGFATPRYEPAWLWADREDVQSATRDALHATPDAQARHVALHGPFLAAPAIREWVLARLDDEVAAGLGEIATQTGPIRFLPAEDEAESARRLEAFRTAIRALPIGSSVPMPSAPPFQMEWTPTHW